MTQQLELELDFNADAAADRGSLLARKRADDRRNLRRAVLRWLLKEDPPTACATGVMTRITRFRADVAAFWSKPVRNPHEEGPGQILTPIRAALIQCHLGRDECWPDCSRSAELIPRLRELKARLVDVEGQIRRDEPGLRETGSLFEEYAEWRYESSSNREYHQLKREIEKTEHALYHGTRFERIRSACLADQLYLAVPDKLVLPEELADGWGLLWVSDDLRVTVAARPAPRECLPQNRLHLVQNTAAAASRAVLFANGIDVTADGTSFFFVRPPRARRKREPGTAAD
jgi:hypothetical protein